MTLGNINCIKMGSTTYSDLLVLHSSKQSCEKVEKKKTVSVVLWRKKKRDKKEKKVGKAFRVAYADRRVTRAAAVSRREKLPVLLRKGYHWWATVSKLVTNYSFFCTRGSLMAYTIQPGFIKAMGYQWDVQTCRTAILCRHLMYALPQAPLSCLHT